MVEKLCDEQYVIFDEQNDITKDVANNLFCQITLEKTLPP